VTDDEQRPEPLSLILIGLVWFPDSATYLSYTIMNTKYLLIHIQIIKRFQKYLITVLLVQWISFYDTHRLVTHFSLFYRPCTTSRVSQYPPSTATTLLNTEYTILRHKVLACYHFSSSIRVGVRIQMPRTGPAMGDSQQVPIVEGFD